MHGRCVRVGWLLVLLSGCSGSTNSDESPGSGGASGGGSGGMGNGTGGSVQQCVENITGVTPPGCKACLAEKCSEASSAYCTDPGYSEAKACFAGCPSCATDCEVAYNQCSQACGVGDVACCSTCSSERQTCSSACPTPACDCVPLGSSLFDAAAGFAACMAFSCVSECAEQIGHC